MRSQPSGPPPVRDDVDYHVMAMSTNISSFSVKIIRPPPRSRIESIANTNITFFFFWLSSFFSWNFWLMKLMDCSKKLFVAITHAEHLSWLSPRMCTPTIMFPAVTQGRRNAYASSCTSYLNWKDDNTSYLASSSKKSNECRYPVTTTLSVVPVPVVVSLFVAGEGGRRIQCNAEVRLVSIPYHCPWKTGTHRKIHGKEMRFPMFVVESGGWVVTLGSAIPWKNSQMLPGYLVSK